MIPKSIAIVTGANRGLGLQAAKNISQEGIPVLMTARDQSNGQKTFEKLKTENGLDKIFFHPLDLNSDSSIADLVEHISNEYPDYGIILLNNAGRNWKLDGLIV